MRWELIDRFEVLKRGARSRAVKSFTGGEDFFSEHYPGRALVPEPLCIEMIAQAGGVLYGLGLDFEKEVILAKIIRATFGAPVAPPCRFVIEARIDEEREDAALVTGTVSVDGTTRPVAEASLLLVAIAGLGDLAGDHRKIVFNERFLDHYDIWNVAKASEAAPA